VIAVPPRMAWLPLHTGLGPMLRLATPPLSATARRRAGTGAETHTNDDHNVVIGLVAVSQLALRRGDLASVAQPPPPEYRRGHRRISPRATPSALLRADGYVPPDLTRHDLACRAQCSEATIAAPGADRRNGTLPRRGTHRGGWVARWALPEHPFRTDIQPGHLADSLPSVRACVNRPATRPQRLVLRHADPVPHSHCCRRGAFRDCPASTPPAAG
jgi:hypothetical protein